MKIVDKNEKQNVVTLEIKLDLSDWERGLNLAYLKERGRIATIENLPTDHRVPKSDYINELILNNQVLYKVVENNKYKIMEIAEKEVEEDDVWVSPHITGFEQPNPKVSEGVVSVEWLKEPEITVPDLKAYMKNVETPLITEIDEEEIDALIENLQIGNRRLVPKESPAEEGDVLDVDFLYKSSLFSDRQGEIVELISEDDDSSFFLDENNNYRENLIPGEVFTVNNENWLNPQEEVEVHINQVYVPEMDEIDDEFASEVSEYETLEEMRRAISEDLYKERLTSVLQTKLKEALPDLFANEVEIDLDKEYLPTKDNYSRALEAISLLTTPTPAADIDVANHKLDQLSHTAIAVIAATFKKILEEAGIDYSSESDLIDQVLTDVRKEQSEAPISKSEIIEKHPEFVLYSLAMQHLGNMLQEKN